MEGMGEGKLVFPLLKSVKTSERPLGQSVSINFVADCRVAYFWVANNYDRIHQEIK